MNTKGRFGAAWMNIRTSGGRLFRSLVGIRHAGVRIAHVEPLERRALLSATPTGQFTIAPFKTYGGTIAFDQPQIAVGADGKFVVIWATDPSATLGDPTRVLGQRFAADGSPQGGSFQVNDPTDLLAQEPHVAMDAAGDFVVAWGGESSGGKGSLYQRQYAANGAPQSAPTPIAAGSDPSVAMDQSGNFVVAYDNGLVFAQRYDATGAAQGAAIQVTPAAVQHAIAGGVSMNAGGSFVVSEVVAVQGGDVYVSRYAPGGAPQGGAIQVNSGNGGGIPAVAINDAGSFVVSWLDGSVLNGSVFAQRFSAAGAAVGGNEAVSPSGVYISVGIEQDGSFVVGWTGNNAVSARSFDANGNPMGAEFAVNASAAGTVQGVSLVGTPQGGFDAVWQDVAFTRPGPSSGQINGQRFVQSTPPPPATVVVDNRDAGVTLTGRWWYASNEPGFYKTDFLNDGNTGKGNKSVQFAPNLPSAGSYSVYARWPAAAGNASSVPVDVVAADGTHTVLVNEQVNGNQWALLGTYSFNAAGGSVIVRTAGTSGLVVADAVEFSQSAPPVVTSPAAPTGLQAAAASSTQVNLTWTDPAGNNEAGFKVEYQPAGGAWATAGDAAAGASSFPVTGLAANTSYAFRVSAFNSAGSSGFAAAGPVMTPPAPSVNVVVDNRSPGVTLTGRWWYSKNQSGFYGPDFLNDGNTGKGTKSVRFTPSLPTAGTYAVSVWYPAAAGNAGSVPVDVVAADGTHTVMVNEQTNGGQWVLLGTYSFNAAGGSVLFRTDGTSGLVVADAVQFSKA